MQADQCSQCAHAVWYVFSCNTQYVESLQNCLSHISTIRSQTYWVFCDFVTVNFFVWTFYIQHKIWAVVYSPSKQYFSHIEILPPHLKNIYLIWDKWHSGPATATSSCVAKASGSQPISQHMKLIFATNHQICQAPCCEISQMSLGGTAQICRILLEQLGELTIASESSIFIPKILAHLDSP